MRTRLLLFIAPFVLAASTVSAQSRDPYFATFTGAYDLLYHELSEELPPFALSAQLDENPEVVGARIRAALGVTVAEQFR